MSHQEWTPTRALAGRMKALRRDRGWTATDLAQRMLMVGFRWDRFTVQHLESGRRRAVSLDESVALAGILGVSLADLVAPIRED